MTTTVCSPRSRPPTSRRETVNAIETGKYDPGLPLAFKIARLFERRIEDVFDPDL